MGPIGDPMAEPSNCFLKVLLKMKNNSFVANHKSFSKLSRSRIEMHCFLSNDPFKQIFKVSSRGILNIINNEFMSRLAVKQSEFC